jgi:acetyltransferase-like isoleucine patch superfamily enzyme
VTIGSGVLVSGRVGFIGNDHEIPPAGVPLFTAGRRPSQHVVLEGDNLIGHGTLILGSVTIGHGAVVGAGSLVLGDVPPNTVYGGRPASFLRCREDADLSGRRSCRSAGFPTDHQHARDDPDSRGDTEGVVRGRGGPAC